MMFSALMLIAVSMKANSTTTVGTTDDVVYEATIDNLTYESHSPQSYASGRRAGRAAGRAARVVVGYAWLAAEVAYEAATHFLGGTDTINKLELYSESDMTDFDN